MSESYATGRPQTHRERYMLGLSGDMEMWFSEADRPPFSRKTGGA